MNNSKTLRIAVLTITILCALIKPIDSLAQIAVQKNLSAFSFTDGNLFKIIEFSQTGELNQSYKATLFLNGKMVYSQNGLSTGLNGLINVNAENGNSSFKALMLQGILPVGSYQLCVQSLANSQQDCTVFSVYPTTNSNRLSLTFPKNKSSINNKYPVLSWMSSVSSFDGIVSYRLKLLPEDDLGRKNIFRLKSLPSLFTSELTEELAIQYPIQAIELQDGKSYAWAVEMYFDDKLICQSETWTFSLEENFTDSKYDITRDYLSIESLNDSPHFYFEELMKLKYTPSKGNEVIDLKIFDANEKELKLKKNSIKFTKQQPYIVYNLEENSSLGHLHNYTVLFHLENGTTKRIKVTYIKPGFKK